MYAAFKTIFLGLSIALLLGTLLNVIGAGGSGGGVEGSLESSDELLLPGQCGFLIVCVSIRKK